MEIALAGNDALCDTCRELASGGLGYLETLTESLQVDIDNFRMTVDERSSTVELTAKIIHACKRCGRSHALSKILGRIPYHFRPVGRCINCQRRNLTLAESSLQYDDSSGMLVASIRYECPACGRTEEGRLTQALAFVARQLDRLKRLVIGPKGIEIELRDS